MFLLTVLCSFIVTVLLANVLGASYW